MGLAPAGPVLADRTQTVTISVHQLASNDGRYEASGGAEWVVDSGRRIGFVNDADSLGIESGSRLEVSASSVRKNGTIAASAVKKGRLVGHVRRAGVIPARKVVVVPVQWSGAPWSAPDRANVDSIVSQLPPWWNAMSGRQETLSFKVLATADASSTVAAGSCDLQAIADAAQSQAEKSGLAGQYDHIIATFSTSAKGCGFSGLGEVGGSRVWAYAGAGFAGVWAHELGHNLGFPHANVCNAGVALTYMAPCTDVEYGNNADVMGSSVLSSFFSPTFLEQASFLPAQNKSQWAGGATATYTIARADRTDLGTTAVEILPTDPASGDNTFWLQYNPNRIGAVPQAATPENGGIAITMEPSAEFVSAVVTSEGVLGAAASTSYICDLTPPTSDLSARDMTTDPRLAVGRSWTDPRDRFKVTVVSADGNVAVVTVEPLAAASVWAAATVSATPDPSGAAGLGVAWTPNLSNIGAHEPAYWKVDTVEDPARTCIVSVFTLGCSLSGMLRSVVYTPRVSGVNGGAVSSPSIAGTAAVPVSPPTFSATFSSTDTQITAVITTGDGGGTVTGQPTAEITGMPPCVLTVNAATTCTFSGLARRSTHIVVTKGTNEAGSREKSFSATTLAGVPATPEVDGRLSGNDLVVTIMPSGDDQSNVDYYYLQCTIGTKSWSKLLPADLEHNTSLSMNVPAVKGHDAWCYTAAIAMGATRQFTSDYGAVKVSKGKVTAGRLSLSAVAEAARAGLISVKWSAKDSLGKKVVVSVDSSTKKCARTNDLACSVSGLPSGASVVLRIVARGQSGSRTVWKTVVVK